MELLWRLDQSVQHFLNAGLHSPAADWVFWFFTLIGLDQALVPAVIVLLCIRHTRACGIQCFLAYAIAGLSAILIKYTCPRLRPGAVLDGVLLPPDERVYLNSFPSGHATIAFAIAFSLAMAWPGNRKLVGATGIVIATLVGISRVYRGVHWPTDVIASLALALLAACVARYALSLGSSKAVTRPLKELA